MPLYRDQGVVLRTHKLGEADRIITLFTAGHGRIRAVAKGIRRTKSRFGARLEPMSWVNGQFYEGRNLDIVTQVETAHRFDHLRTDPERLHRAAVMLEAVERTTQEGGPDRGIFNLLTGALRELDRTGNHSVLPAFVAKLLMLEGIQPQINRCVQCGTQDRIEAINIHQGGVLCHDHRSGQPIGPAVRQALSLIFAGDIRQMLDSTAPAVAGETEILAIHLLEQHLERRLKSAIVFRTAI
jgi:DNA repair protein RecO (recombination protein O)